MSRAHLRFDLDSDRLTITDQSRNGTELFLRDGTHLFLHRATRPFTIGDRAQVHPSLEIIRSGRRYPSELAAQRRTRRPPPSEPPSTVSYWNPP